MIHFKQSFTLNNDSLLTIIQFIVVTFVPGIGTIKFVVMIFLDTSLRCQNVLVKTL